LHTTFIFFFKVPEKKGKPEAHKQTHSIATYMEMGCIFVEE